MGQPVELFEPGEYLNQHRPGYFSVLAKPNGQAKQTSYPLEHLATVVEGLNPHYDTWISQATFSQPNRRAVNVSSVGLLFADLDTYHMPGLKGMKPEKRAQMLVFYCTENGIPAPSIVLFSGRGLQAKWILSEALEPARLTEWNHVQLELVKRLEDFGSDRMARDISRVLRLDRTVNSKSGERCRVVYLHSGVDGVPSRYDFDELAELFPEQKPEPRPSSGAGIVRIPDSLNLKRLNWYRLYDIRDLWRLRGGVPKGYREVTLFWELNFMMRADPVRYQDLWKEAESLAKEIDDGEGFYHDSDLSTLYRKAMATASGETVTYRGRQYPALYTPRNTTLATIFEITPEEEQHLRTIISYDEKQRRRREARRAQGVRAQSESIEATRPWESMGISRSTYYRYHHTPQRQSYKSSTKVVSGAGDSEGQGAI